MSKPITQREGKSSPFFALVLYWGSRMMVPLRLPLTFDASNGRSIMADDEPIRREVLQTLAALPFMALLASQASAQVGVSPVKVDTKGLVAKIKFEAPLEGFLKEINGKYKLRVTELTLAPGGYVGEHNHEGPGIRQVTSGYMTYVLPDKTVIYGPGDFFFESGDINHTVFNKTDAPMVHVLFEILPVNLNGPSLITVRHH